jgi:hypothetical protein
VGEEFDVLEDAEDADERFIVEVGIEAVCEERRSGDFSQREDSQSRRERRGLCRVVIVCGESVG